MEKAGRIKGWDKEELRKAIEEKMQELNDIKVRAEKEKADL